MTITEVLLAWLLLMLSVFSSMPIAITQLHQLRHAYFISVATLQLSNMAERLYAQKTNQTAEQRRWNQINPTVLPQGRGSVHCTDTCRITLHWKEQQWETQTLSVLR